MTTYSHQYEPITDPDELELVRSAFAATGRVPTGYAYSPRWSPPFRKIVGGGGTPPPAHLTPVEQWLADRIKALEAGGGGGGGGTPGSSMLMLTLTSGDTAMLVMPFTGQITGWTIVGDSAGTASVDLRRGAFGTIPGPGQTIVGTTPPALAGGDMARQVVIGSDWEPQFNAGDLVQVVAGTFTGVTTITLALHIARDGASDDIPFQDPYRDMILEEPGLVAYWPLSDPQGDTFKDAKGNHHGSVGNTDQVAFRQPSILPIGGGTCVALAPDPGDPPMLTVPHDANISFTSGDFTIECWTKNYSGSGQHRTIVGKGANSGVREFRFGITSGGDLRATLYTSSGSQHIVHGPMGKDLHHLVLTRDGDDLYFDVDGVRHGPKPLDGSINVTTSPLCFGVWEDGYEYYRGFLQHVAVYSRAFTHADSLAHYEMGVGS